MNQILVHSIWMICSKIINYWPHNRKKCTLSLTEFGEAAKTSCIAEFQASKTQPWEGAQVLWTNSKDSKQLLQSNSESEVHVFPSRSTENTTTEHEPSLNRERRKHKGSWSVQTASHTPGLNYLGKRGPPALLDQPLDFVINLNNIKSTQ